MKQLYPSPEYRWMSDADIIIRESQYDRIAEIIKTAGYSFEYNTGFELKWKKSDFYMEFHTAAISIKMKDSMNYFSNIFQRSVPFENTHRYHMTDTDEMIYTISHLAKHYISGGTRLRSFLDLYYLFQKNDKESSELLRTLDDLKLHHFYNVVKRTIENWFSDIPMDDECELLLKNVFSESEDYLFYRSFTYKMTNADKGGTEKAGSSRKKTVFKKLFPSCHLMQIRYPVLKKAPFLLPFFWIWRGISTLLFHRKNMKRVFDIGVLNSSSVMNEYMDELRALGLESTVLPEELL